MHVIVGMVVAVVGMIWYGYASSQPGGKERVPSSSSSSSSNEDNEEEAALVKSDHELDENV